MQVITKIKYDDQHTKLEAGTILNIVSFGIGGLYNNIVWVSISETHVSSEPADNTFPIISEFVTKYCKQII